MLDDVRWWCHPAAIVAWCLVAFVPLRYALGGANYLPSAAWYGLCFVIPAFVLIGVGSGAFCVPLQADTATLFHVGATLVYLQLDLCVSRWLVGPEFGDCTVPGMVLPKLNPCAGDRLDGLLPPGMPPLARSLFEFNGALFHEIFWNVFICQNCLQQGLPLPVALLAVPAVSCLVHGIVSNFQTGVRCFPNFIWVALAYHASGSVVPPALIHAMWYFLDAKLCFSLGTMKRNWDAESRKTECGTPPWDRTCSIAVLLILAFYGPLNLMSHSYPHLRSSQGIARALDGCSNIGHAPQSTIERGLLIAGSLQLFLGAATWRVIRAGMAVVAESGDFTDEGMEAMADAVAEEHAAQERAVAAVCPCLAALGCLDAALEESLESSDVSSGDEGFP